MDLLTKCMCFDVEIRGEVGGSKSVSVLVIGVVLHNLCYHHSYMNTTK